MGMTQGQRKYAIAKVTELRNMKLSRASEDCFIKGKTLSNRERVALIRGGKVHLNPPRILNDLSDYALDHIDKVFDFSEFEYPNSYTKPYAGRVAKINQAYEKACDEIMLGDASDAQEIIKAFEAI